jgi:hypothetical protein
MTAATSGGPNIMLATPGDIPLELNGKGISLPNIASISPLLPRARIPGKEMKGLKPERFRPFIFGVFTSTVLQGVFITSIVPVNTP